MIDGDKIKVGQRVWFKNGDKIESGCITGWGQQAFGPIAFNIRKDPDQNGFAPTLEGWRACFLYETKLDCLRAILNANNTRVGYLASELSNYEKRSNELAAQVKAEEEKARAANRKTVRGITYIQSDEAVVELPRVVMLDCGVGDGIPCEFPAVVRHKAQTNFILCRYAFMPAHANPFKCVVFPCDKSGEIVGNRYHAILDVKPRDRLVTLIKDDIRAAVKSLGFELED